MRSSIVVGRLFRNIIIVSDSFKFNIVKKAAEPGVHKYTILTLSKNEDTGSVISATQKPDPQNFLNPLSLSLPIAIGTLIVISKL